MFGDELEGISKQSGVPLGLLCLAQIGYELMAGCTSIVYHNENGVPCMIRTMDWNLECLRELTIHVDFVKGGRTLYSGTTWAGFVGLLTGMRRSEYSVSVNFRSLNSVDIYKKKFDGDCKEFLANILFSKICIEHVQ